MQNKLKPRKGSLTDEQVSAFHRDGFVVVKVFDEADFEPVQREIASWLDIKARALHAEGRIRNLHSDAPFSTRFGFLADQDVDMHHGYDTTDILGDELFAIMRHQKMLDAVASLLGDEISLNPIQHLRAKPPDTQSHLRGRYDVPWHQDSGVTTADADASLIITAWTPLGPATADMGCMRLHPGVHKHGHMRHIQVPGYGTTIDPELLPKGEPVPAPCAPGEIVLMGQFTPHCSTPNLSSMCRWSMDLRYQANGTPSGRAWYPTTVLRSPSAPSSEVHEAALWRTSWQDALSRPNPGIRHRLG